MSRTQRATHVGRALVLGAGSVAVGRRLARRQLDRTRRLADWSVLRTGPVQPLTHHQVLAADGTCLAVIESGPPEAEVTAVLLHGWTLSSELWDAVAEDLATSMRVLRVDHRGHGSSERGPEAHLTIDQLGRDLGTVIDALASEGDVVLVGHSMGGMAIMHLAAQRPEMFGPRVVGAVLVATSLGLLATLDLGLPRPAARLVQRYSASMLRILGSLESHVAPVGKVPAEIWFAVRSLNYGPGVPARHVDEMIRVVRRTRLGVVAAFYSALLEHDGAACIPALLKVPVEIVVGDSDRLTPVAHARRISACLPHAGTTVVHDAGHMVVQERPDLLVLAVRGVLSAQGKSDVIATGVQS